MKFPFLVLLSTIFISGLFAQTPPKLAEPPQAEPCRAQLSDLPALRGLRLGMAKADVLKEYPSMKINSDPIKSGGVVLNHQISNPAYVDNLERITVMFKNDRIFSILFTYTNSIIWDSAQEFADKISASLNLPKARPIRADGNVFYSVNCGSFMVRTRINGEKQPTLFLTMDPSEIWESVQQRKDAFKP
jgi:hypothetical protein